MNKKDIDKLIERLRKLAKDYDDLSNIDPEHFLISEMREYRDDITDWIEKLFNNIDHHVGVYLSGVPSPNRDGFIYRESNSDLENRRILKNLTFFDSRPGNNRLLKGEPTSPGDYPKYTERDLHDVSVGAMAVGTYVLAEQDEQHYSDPSDEVLTEQDRYEEEYDQGYEDAVSDGYSGGIFSHDGDIVEAPDVNDISIF